MKKTPKIDERDFERIVEELKALAPYYVSEFEVSEDRGAGIALIKIFANMLKIVIDRLNRVPEKNFAAFLDMLGIQLLPAQPSRAPVTFYLSEGAKKSVLIPERSQASAEEIVFETEKNMVATPSKLVKAYSISVDKDEIFASPPNIVKGEVAFPFSFSLQFTAAEGDRKLVLREVSGLEKGDILKIGCTEEIDYVEVSEVSDTKVSIRDKMVHTHGVGTSVEKVTKLELIEGLNLQEHILYLGHEDLFNIKGEATIKIKVTDSQSASNLGDFNIVQWEYWGEAIRTEDTKESKEVDWHPLTIDTSKAPISLQKTGWTDTKGQTWKSGEIKECELNGVKSSRWIRCKTTDIAKTTDIVLDIIQIGVDSVQWASEFYKFPPKAIRGVGVKFGERLTKSDVNTIEELLKFKGRTGELAKILSSEEKPSKYYEKAENILESAEKRILDKKYENEGNGKVVTQGMLPDIAFYNDVPLDLTLSDSEEFKTPVCPFGKVPRLYDTFFIASQECFSKKNTEISIKFYLSQCGQAEADGITLSWEYWNGKGWTVIKDLTDNTNNFTELEQEVKFTCPEDIKLNQVSGQENYWVRVRIVSGDYGKEKFKKVEEDSTGDSTGDSTEGTWEIKTDQIIPPGIKKLTITYDYGLRGQNLQHCLTYNNLEFKDVTEESKTKDKTFEPFQPLNDEHQTLYLGLDKKIEKGPISIFFSLEEQEFLIEDMPKIEWYCYSQEKKWVRLEGLDATRNLTRTGAVEFIVPTDFAKTSKFGDELYWINAVDIEDKFRTQSAAKVKGIYLNTTFAIQAESINDELLGSCDGSADQEFQFTRFPVIKEEIWINETGTLLEEEKKAIIEEKGEVYVSESKEETWVRWQAVEDFFDSTSKSRHYGVDRATGEVRFGDGESGMVPPIGRDNIKAIYQVGGGERGNVGASEISTMKTSIPFMARVTNPEPAEGGSDIELLESVFERGPHLIKHRDRAVTEEDFERLAKAASSYIARTRCFTEGNKLKILLIPKGEEDKPTPSLGLMKKVEKQLLDRCLNLILPVSIKVQEPSYKEVRITVDVVPESIDQAIPLEKAIVKRLKEFLHPLTGGPEECGWEFGRDVHISDVYALLEGIEAVDHVAKLELNDESGDVEVKEDETVCSGEHRIVMKLGGQIK